MYFVRSFPSSRAHKKWAVHGYTIWAKRKKHLVGSPAEQGKVKEI